jgi:hypothetical protein
VETAAHDLTEEELGQLKALIKSMERTQRWHRGRWAQKGQEVRQCESCDLDLPRDASSQMRRDAHCRKRDHRARQAARRPASPAEGPHVPQTGRKTRKAAAQ